MKTMRRLLRRPTIMAGVVIVALFTFVAVFAPLLEPYPIDRPSGAAFAPPSAAHWLGCDDAGVDMLSLVIAGAQNSMLVGFLAAFVAVAIGGTLGIIAGYKGSWGETTVTGVTDFFLVIPALPLMIVLAALFGQTIYHIVLVIGLLSWMSVTYVVRAQVHTLKERGFVSRARSLGAGDLYIIRHHILPHVAPLLVAQTVLTVATRRVLRGGARLHRPRRPGARLLGHDHPERLPALGGLLRRLVGDRAARRLHRPRRARLLPHRPGRRGGHEPAPRARPRRPALLPPAPGDAGGRA